MRIEFNGGPFDGELLVGPLPPSEITRVGPRVDLADRRVSPEVFTYRRSGRTRVLPDSSAFGHHAAREVVSYDLVDVRALV